MISEDIQQLKGVVEHWRELYRENRAPTVSWRGRQELFISEGIQKTVRSLRKTLQTTDFRRKEWRHVLAADKFVDEYTKWEQDWATEPELTPPAGQDGLWMAYDRMLESLKPVVERTLEPIEELFRQNVSVKQIAKMYGWYKEDGEPDHQKVFEERAKPGTHTDGGVVRAPESVRAEEELSSLWEGRSGRVRAAIEKQEAENPEAPEELEDLVVLSGITMKQILKMKPKVSEQDVHAACKRMGVKVLGEMLVRPANAVGRTAQAEEEARQQQEDLDQIASADRKSGIEDLQTRVEALSDQGLKPAQISTMLKEEGITLAATSIGKMLRNAQSPVKA